MHGAADRRIHLTDRGEKLIHVMQGINGWVDGFFGK